MKKINIEDWYRKTQYNNFINYTHPVFSIGTNLDVTKLVSYCEERDLSFFSAFLYIVTRCINEVDEMKYRIMDDGVVMFDEIHPGYVVLCDNNELRTCVTHYNSDFQAFYNQTRIDIEKTKENECISYNENNGLDSFYISCLPWIKFNSLSNPYNFSDKEQTSIPRITWGKYYKNGDNYEINFDFSGHHALVDGMQACDFIKKVGDQLLSLSFMEG